jgi:hypothetical protein
MFGKPFGTLARRFAIAGTAALFFCHPITSATAAVTPQQVTEFVSNPASILQANPEGGGRLVALVRDLVLANPATLPAIIALLARANPAQQAAIGSGLGQAAQSSVRANPTLANQIQEALAASGVQVAIASFAATTGNVPVAGTAAGGGGVGGPTNSSIPTGGGSGGGGTTGAAGGTTSSGGSLSGAGGGGSGGGSSGTTTTSTAAQGTSTQ